MNNKLIYKCFKFLVDQEIPTKPEDETIQKELLKELESELTEKQKEDSIRPIIEKIGSNDLPEEETPSPASLCICEHQRQDHMIDGCSICECSEFRNQEDKSNG